VKGGVSGEKPLFKDSRRLLAACDGAMIDDESSLAVTGKTSSEILLFDLG